MSFNQIIQELQKIRNITLTALFVIKLSKENACTIVRIGKLYRLFIFEKIIDE